jgi:hypothetical protein
VWDASKGTPKLQKENEWSDLYVTIQGQKISTSINGQVALDNAELPARSTRGGIGFQRHGTPKYKDTVIEFRDIELAEL